MTTSRRSLLKGLTSATALSAGSLIPDWANALTPPPPPPPPPIPTGAIKGSKLWAATTDKTLWDNAWAKRFTNVLPNPLAAAAIYAPLPGTVAEYTVKASQGTTDILGVGVMSTVWGYHNQETTPTFPGRTFQVTKGTPISVHWVNNLATAAGAPLPHILPIDQSFALQTATTGVPLAVHHHGGDTAVEFDGTPDQWATPLRKQTGPGIAVGSAVLNPVLSTAGTLTYRYDNNQEASMHWYHDHADTITGVNVGAGLAGLYAVRDANEANLRAIGRLPPLADEVALVIQDRVFDAAGQINYSASQANFPTKLPPTFPAGIPSHMPEVFGDVIVINGKAWPSMNIEARRYRFRVLNGSDSRFYTLTFDLLEKFNSPGVPAWVIGTDLGFLNSPVMVPSTGVTIAPGERLDLIVDFSFANPGRTYFLKNSAGTPFQGAVNTPPTPGSGTNVLMRFNMSRTPAVLPLSLAWFGPLRGTNGTPVLPPVVALPPTTPVRKILLGEGTDAYGRILPMLGVYDPVTPSKNAGTLSFSDPATETPKLGSTEIWEFWNTTVDSHPIHLHLVQFRIMNRQAFHYQATPNSPKAPYTGLIPTTMINGASGVRLDPASVVMDGITPPERWEDGWKDTVQCPPGSVTRIQVTFNRPGKYVYHCHILSHEDHDMMRWYQVI